MLTPSNLVMIVVGICVNIKDLKIQRIRKPYSNSFHNATFDIFRKVDTANTLMLQYAFGG